MEEDPREIREEIADTLARMGQTVEALGYKTDVKTRAREKVSDKVEAVKSKVGGAGSRVNEATPGSDDVKQSARKAAGIAQENPIGLALGSLAVGFIAGLLAPSTASRTRSSARSQTRSRSASRRPPRRPASAASRSPSRPRTSPSRAVRNTPRSSSRPHSRRPKRPRRRPAPRTQSHGSTAEPRTCNGPIRLGDFDLGRLNPRR